MSIKVYRALIPTCECGTLNAKVYFHWKDSPYFTQVRFSCNKIVELRCHKLSSDELIIDIVRREKIDYIIAQSLSVRAIELLRKLGVKVLIGNIKTVRDAIESFWRGRLYQVKLVKLPFNPMEM